MFGRARPPRRIVPLTPVIWLPDHPPPVADLATLAFGTFELCPAASLHDGQQAPAIHLARLPAGAVVFGGGGFATASGGRFVREQLPPGTSPDFAAMDAIAPLDLRLLEHDEEVLLAGRYGLADPAIWLTALLPAILLAEHAFPGRFRLLLPEQVTAPPAGEHPAGGPAAGRPDAAIWDMMRRSLEACGIGLSRILPAEADANCRFSALYAVQPVWSGGRPHPAALAAVRQACAHIPPALAGQEPADPSFEGQVAGFKGASSIRLADRGEAAFVMFSPAGVRVAAAGLDEAGRSLLQALVLDRGGTLADPPALQD